MKKFLILLAAILVCIGVERTARANFEGISSRFAAFTNNLFGPALGAASTSIAIPDTGSASNMWTNGGYEYSIEKGRGVGLFVTISGTNAAFTNAVTFVFDFSPFGTAAKTNTITGSNQNFFPFGASGNYTSGTAACGAFIWTLSQGGNATNTYFTNVPAALMDNARWMRETSVTVGTNASGTNAFVGSITLSPVVISEFP